MILRNCEIFFPKLDRPNAKFNRANPTWELQIRTQDKAQKKEWENAGLNVKTIDPDEGSVFYRCNLRKRSIKANGEEAAPPQVVDGSLNPIDPTSIGNGSIGNIKLYQYEYTDAVRGKKVASVLMGVQITKHVKYTPPPFEDFEETDTEVVEEDEEIPF